MKPASLTLLFLLSACTTVSAADWVVSRVAQPAKISLDRKSWKTLTRGMTIPNESWISTGVRGRVSISRGEDLVTYQPNTLASVTERQSMFSKNTDFAQQTGTLTLEIDPKVKPHLSVQTPYLAAIVKGTVFSVSVDDKGATVGVDRGRVEVTDAMSGEQTGVHAGQVAAVDLDPATSMALSGKNKAFEAVQQVAPFTPAVAAIGVTAAAPGQTVGETSAAANAGAGKSAGRSASGHGHAGDRGGSADRPSDRPSDRPAVEAQPPGKPSGHGPAPAGGKGHNGHGGKKGNKGNKGNNGHHYGRDRNRPGHE